MSPHRSACAAAALALLLGACGGQHHHAHDEAHTTEAGATVSFKAGQGLRLPEETRRALGVTLADVEERTLARVSRVTATVFDAGPPARATLFVAPAVADELERHPPAGVRILAVRRELSAALTQAEVVLALPGTPAVGSTVELPLRGPEEAGLAVPRSAVLPTASGTFVYVANGDFLLRTAVKTGASDGQYVAIADGLYAGDAVAAAAVEQLWLTELRLTKGGGHSH